MENASVHILLVAEGSGGHLIPALEVANRLAQSGAHVQLWYAQRPQTAGLTRLLTQQHAASLVEMRPIECRPNSNLLQRVWQCRQLWQHAQHCFNIFHPDVVVGFGGWVSAPVILAARTRRIACLLHEQNVVLGRTNQWLARWVDRIAVSFGETQAKLGGVSSVVTGMPVRPAIGNSSRERAAARFSLSAHRPTVLVLGGSQGAQAINSLMSDVVGLWSCEERQTWQVLHITGSRDEVRVKAAYAAAGVTSWVAPFCAEMEHAYSVADVVVARAGASTIAELARCGKPAVLIPYPHAAGHQRVNARMVENVGGGLVIEEAEATAARLLGALRCMMIDQRLRMMMGRQMRTLEVVDAAERVTQIIRELSRTPAPESIESPAHELTASHIS